MSITVIVENDSIKLPPGVHVPDGTKVEVTLPDESTATAGPGNALGWMTEFAGTIDGPEDFAAEHDH